MPDNSQTTDEDRAKQSLAAYHEGMDKIKSGNLNDALVNFVDAVTLNQDEPIFRLQLATTANAIARETDPLREMAFQNASHLCKIYPDNVIYWIALGEISLNALKFHEAVAAFERALDVAPEHPSAASIWSLMGFAHQRSGNFPETMRCYQTAVKIDPDHGKSHFFLSLGYMTPEYYDAEKMAHHAERAFMSKKIDNDHLIEAHWNAALGFLSTGDYAKGWSYYESRLHRMTKNIGHQLAKDRFTKTMWKGERNCRVLITAEMGLGDLFIMARFFRQLQAKFDFTLLLECQKQALGLMHASFPEITCLLKDEINEDMFDHHIPLMSLPHILRIKENSVPNGWAYLKPSREKVNEWGNKVFGQPLCPTIGVCWSGGSRAYNADNYQTDKRRSLKFAQINKILEIPGINFVSLQAEGAPDHFRLHPDAKTFEDTAAIMQHLDAVVSVDTSVINLAGAMGIKSWVLSRHDGCWRWSDKIKTPWYPSVKIIRQAVPYQWDAELEQLSSELKVFRDNMRE